MKKIKIEKIKTEKLPKKYITLMHAERKREYNSKRNTEVKKEDKKGVFFFARRRAAPL